MDQESHLSILELSEAQAGEVGPVLRSVLHRDTDNRLCVPADPQAFRTYYTHGLISSNIPDKRYSSHLPNRCVHLSSLGADGIKCFQPKPSAVHAVREAFLLGGFGELLLQLCLREPPGPQHRPWRLPGQTHGERLSSESGVHVFSPPVLLFVPHGDGSLTGSTILTLRSCSVQHPELPCPALGHISSGPLTLHSSVRFYLSHYSFIIALGNNI